MSLLHIFIQLRQPKRRKKTIFLETIVLKTLFITSCFSRVEKTVRLGKDLKVLSAYRYGTSEHSVQYLLAGAGAGAGAGAISRYCRFFSLSVFPARIELLV